MIRWEILFILPPVGHPLPPRSADLLRCGAIITEFCTLTLMIQREVPFILPPAGHLLATPVRIYYDAALYSKRRNDPKYPIRNPFQ